MGIKHYSKGEHAGGFVGFRVTSGFGGRYQENYFSTSAAKVEDETDPLFKMQKLKARIQLLEWKMESILYQYQRFISTNRPNTKPERGVGVNGITAIFFQASRANGQRVWIPAFNVSQAGKPGKRFSFKQYLYSEAWEQAVRGWAQIHEILPADKERILKSCPDPEQFKRLRRVMNNDGMDIPVEALSLVFREEREKLGAVKASQELKKISLNSEKALSDRSDDASSAEAEILEWFKREQRQSS